MGVGVGAAVGAGVGTGVGAGASQYDPLLLKIFFNDVISIILSPFLSYISLSASRGSRLDAFTAG